MTPLELIELSAITWYLSYALTQTQGAFGMFVKLREWRKGKWHGRKFEPEFVVTSNANTSYETIETKGGEVKYHGVLDCIVCTAPWVALALVLVTGHTVLDAFAVAGVALLAHSYTGWRINM